MRRNRQKRSCNYGLFRRKQRSVGIHYSAGGSGAGAGHSPDAAKSLCIYPEKHDAHGCSCGLFAADCKGNRPDSAGFGNSGNAGLPFHCAGVYFHVPAESAPSDREGRQKGGARHGIQVRSDHCRHLPGSGFCRAGHFHDPVHFYAAAFSGFRPSAAHGLRPGSRPGKQYRRYL